MLKILLPFIALSFTACASHSGKSAQDDVVLSRADALDARPAWLSETEPFKIENGQVTSLGMAMIPADNRVEAAYRVAQNNASFEVAKAIEQRLDYIFQNAEEGTGYDGTQSRYIGAEAAKLTTSSLRHHKRYWEKVATTRDSGERFTQYKVFATVSMPEADFKRAVIEAARKREGKGGLSADFAAKVEKHWDQFANPAEKPQ